MIKKGLIHQESIKVINVYEYSNRAPKHKKKNLIELKEEIENSLIIVGDFDNSL